MNELDAYLAENRDRYTREALTKTLVDAGHDPAAVEAAWSRVEGGPIGRWTPTPSDAPAEAPTGKAGPGTMLLAAFAILVYGGSIAAAAWAIGAGGAVSILMIVYVIAMIAGLVYSVRRLLEAPTRGPGWGPIWGAVGLSFVIFVGLSGACFVALGPAINASGGIP